MEQTQKQLDKSVRDHAFLVQFEGIEDYSLVLEKFGLTNYYGNPVAVMQSTGLFGILDALIDLNLTSKEITDFFIHGHVEPYDDPEEFVNGIIHIVYGMPKEEIKKKYGRFLNDDTIEKMSHPGDNTKMLLSFCYEQDDTYEFIPDKDKLNHRFSQNYYREYRSREGYVFFNNQKFQKIDGKLFRAVHFLVRQGYDFPMMEELMDEKIKEIVLKQTNGEKTCILNKEYVQEASDNLLILVSLLQRRNSVLVNPEHIFDSRNDNINIMDSTGKKTVLSRSYLESDIHKYAILKLYNFEIPQILSLFDTRVKKIELKYRDYDSVEHSIAFSRDKLEFLSPEILKVMCTAYNQGFSFLDGDNLLDSKIKIIAPDGKEYLADSQQLDSMLEIFISCQRQKFSIDFEKLFNNHQSSIDIFDKQGKTYTIHRDRVIHMMNLILLLTTNGYHFYDYNYLFDERKPYIVSYDDQNQERTLSRKQIEKIQRLLEASNDKDRKLTDSEKDLLSMFDNDSMKKKLFEWLPYTAKKWIPSSAVISKIPLEKSSEYFNNNNHARLKILKEKYNASSYEEMEGIISLGYILGLFDSKGSTSEKALEYIITYFINKGTPAIELHTTYGAINLITNYNKDFADFFMKHYAIDKSSFIEPDLGTNMTGELFQKFNEVLEKRPEKRINTTTMNKLLTPIDAMAAITDMKVDKSILGEKIHDNRYIELITLLAKFGADNDELKWAIDLYEQALLLDEQKVNIPFIEDTRSELMTFTSHLKSNPQAFLSGRKTNCCSRYGGYAQDRLTHVITDLDWRYVTFTSFNKTFFDGLVWYDKEEKVACIDNVEGQFSKQDKKNRKSIAMMADTVIRYADGIYHEMNKRNIPCKKVNVGNDRFTMSFEIFEYAQSQGLIQEDSNPCHYPKRNGITTDASAQFTITDEKILQLRKNMK